MSDGTVAAWVATILAGRGWTQERLAEEAGLSHKTVWRLADPGSRVRPSLRALRAVAGAAGVPVPEGAFGVRSTRHADAPAEPIPADAPAPGHVPLRSFGPVPARLSPAKRGEISVGRPSSLGDRLDAFAFHAPDARLAPAVNVGDLLYAHAAEPIPGELFVAVTKAGRFDLGFVTAWDEAGLALMGRSGESRIPAADLAEVAEVVLVHRKGRPESIRWAGAA